MDLGQAMTEAAFFAMSRNRTIGYDKMRPLADYRSRLSILDFSLIDLHNFLKVVAPKAGRLEIENCNEA